MVMSEFGNVPKFDIKSDIKFDTKIDIKFDIKGAWLCLNMEFLPSHDEVKTDSHSKPLLENVQNKDKIL